MFTSAFELAHGFAPVKQKRVGSVIKKPTEKIKSQTVTNVEPIKELQQVPLKADVTDGKGSGLVRHTASVVVGKVAHTYNTRKLK